MAHLSSAISWPKNPPFIGIQQTCLGILAYGLLLTQEEDNPKKVLNNRTRQEFRVNFPIHGLSSCQLEDQHQLSRKTKGRSEADLEECMCTRPICWIYGRARWVCGTSLSQYKDFTFICNSLRVMTFVLP